MSVPNTATTVRAELFDFMTNGWVAVDDVSLTGPAVTQYYTLVSQRVAMRQGGVLTYLHGDHLGSASLATNVSGAKVSEQRYLPYGGTRSGSMPTDRQFTGQRGEASLGFYDYVARQYDPALGRFLQADSIVPGAASGSGGGAATLGYDSQTRLTPLTVNLGEFVTQINAENREILQFGFFFRWDARTRQEHSVPLGPYNPQTLNRYAYVLNNPLRYVDPTGHEVVCLSVILISGVVGGVFSAGGSFMAQMIQGNGDFAQRFQTVDWGNVAIAGAVGFAAGALAPVVATTTAAAAILGATANVTQYGLTQWSNNESMTWGGVAVNASVGALTGALISGSFDFQPGSGHYLASGYQWTKSEAAWYNAGDIIVYGLLGASNLSRSLIGGLVDNLEYIR